jgi:endoglucanase
MPKILQLALIVTATAAIAVLATAAVMSAQSTEGTAPLETPPVAAPVLRIGSAAALAAEPMDEEQGTDIAARPAASEAVAAADSGADDSLVPPALWENFKARFVTPEGRVIDDANGSISHSEGQGYGMLLAAFAGDRKTFVRLWSWTQTELLVRDDGLAAWRWEPEADPHITDLNNATDGDILIAWALVEGFERFDDSDYLDAASDLAEAIHASATEIGGYGRVVMPGAVGFSADDRSDGPVVNLSYWVFPALPSLKKAAPDLDWDALAESGLALLGKAQFGERHLPTDWIALGGGKPRPANGFAPSFAYNAIRIPLYLAWSEAGEREDIAPYMALWSDAAAGLHTIDVRSGEALEPLNGAGYEAVAGLVACAMEGRPMSGALRVPSTDPYYPTVLQALSLAAAQEVYSGCR